MAVKGELTKEEWIDEAAKIEHAVLLKARDFYLIEWIPESKKQGVNVDLPSRYKSLEFNYYDWKSNYRTDSYPSKFWGDFFDEFIKRAK